MPDSSEKPKQADSFWKSRAMKFLLAILFFALVLMSLGDVIATGASGSTISLVLGILAMVVSGIAAVLSVLLIIRKRA